MFKLLQEKIILKDNILNTIDFNSKLNFMYKIKLYLGELFFIFIVSDSWKCF